MPSYYSFICTHCYFPKNANRVPIPSLEQMKAQIDANRRLLGTSGPLQITGGDVVDAYCRSGRAGELIEIVRYANQVGLVPVLMIHGQNLLEQPSYSVRFANGGTCREDAPFSLACNNRANVEANLRRHWTSTAQRYFSVRTPRL